jgi:hypothetical protein
MRQVAGSKIKVAHYPKLDRGAGINEMPLGNGIFLKYILREPCDSTVRFLAVGRIERDGPHGLLVYAADNTPRDDLHGGTIRSWCVFGPRLQRVEGWCDVEPLDYSKILENPSPR